MQILPPASMSSLLTGIHWLEFDGSPAAAFASFSAYMTPPYTASDLSTCKLQFNFLDMEMTVPDSLQRGVRKTFSIHDLLSQ